MIHQPIGGIGGTSADIALQAKEIIYNKVKLEEIISKHTGQPIERIKEDSQRDYFLSAAEAASYGLVDKVLEPKALPSAAAAA